jgi:uncharacterized protein (TIGR03089 family)
MVSPSGTARPVRDVPDLLRRLMDDDPGRPRLTWYGPDGERIELSAKVLDNWVAKTANLLVEEFDAGPGSRIALSLPAHWRTVTWLLATWAVGACAVVPPEGFGVADVAHADVLVSDRSGPLAAVGTAVPTVAVALGGLAIAYGPDLPPSALDAAAEVRSRGDVFVPLVRPVPGDPALAVTGSATLEHGGLIPAALAAADDDRLGDRPRLLTDAGPSGAVRGLLAPLVRLGSVVLHHRLPDDGDPELDRLREQEHVTQVLRSPSS